jgi:isochorismate synthase
MSVENTLYKSLGNLQTVCLKQNVPFVSFQLPLHNEITTLVQYKSMPEKLDSLQNIDQKSGFVISPFLESDTHGTFFLRPDEVFNGNSIDSGFIESLEKNTRFISTGKPSEKNIETTQAKDFIIQVNAAVKAIEENKFHKVVLSKIRREKLNDDFNPADFFLRLCSYYPHAFVYLIQLPQVGCWMGASPEPLLEIEKEKVKTISLAGTQIATKTVIGSYTWFEKEFREQKIVTDFVEQTLRSLDIENYSKVGPTNYQAANLIHLKTAFEFPVSELKNRLGVFLKALHPTPSVGGLPKTEARDFILANEKHDRDYYTGFLGPINIDKKSQVFVNLRCLQLFDKQFVLYSGAGITSSSIAENEWEESDNKMMTMMNVMPVNSK